MDYIKVKYFLMSLERRISQLRQENNGDKNTYSLIEGALKRDREAMFAYFKQRGGVQGLDEELADVYELRPEDVPGLTLPNNLSFVAGFSLVVSHWYPAVRVITSPNFKPADEGFFDAEFGRRFRDRVVTAQILREALAADPSGATWLEEMARAEFREGNLELLGARKAIAGARKMYEALTVTV